jgi:hypothetical protein
MTKIDAIVLGCVKGKQRGRHPAADLYTSPLWQRRRAYAKMVGRPWFIFSAKYGLLRPDVEIDSYDVAMQDLSPVERRAIGETAAATLDQALGGLSGRTIEIHAGRLYVDAIRSAIEQRGGCLRQPFGGLSIGQQLRWYDQQRLLGRHA